MSHVVRSAGATIRELPGIRARRLLDQISAATRDGLTVSLVEFSPDNKGHSHEAQEAFFFLEGRATALLGDQENPRVVELLPGDCLYVEPNEFHCVRSAEGEWAKAVVVKTGQVRP